MSPLVLVVGGLLLMLVLAFIAGELNETAYRRAMTRRNGTACASCDHPYGAHFRTFDAAVEGCTAVMGPDGRARPEPCPCAGFQKGDA